MKFVIENNCKVCRELRDSTIAEIYNKMCFIEDNLAQIVEHLFKQYPLDRISKEWEGRKELLANSIDEIMLDTDVDTDEFNLKVGDDYITIELLREGMAEDNDKDFVNEDNGYSKEELENYVVGGTLSIYTRIADKNEEFYFRFL